MNTTTRIDTYALTRTRFDSAAAALKYATRHGGNRRDRREQRCILHALDGVPAGSRVLDLPCGTGRLTPTLVGCGFLVTGADSSPHMVAEARRFWDTLCCLSFEQRPNATFEVRDIMQTGYVDGQFDAVICNRLFHHFTESAPRRDALAELRRICTGPVVISFFNSFALDSIRFRLGDLLSRKRRIDRIPIPLKHLCAEARDAGLTFERAIPTRWGVSPQWYAVFRAH